MTSHTYILEGLCPPLWKVEGALAPLAPPSAATANHDLTAKDRQFI